MGKTGKWFKTFLTGKKEKEKEKGVNEPAQLLPTKNQPAPVPVPSPKEKKRWSFRRSTAAVELSMSAPAAATAATTNGLLAESEMEQKRHALAVAVATAAAADAAVAAAQAAAAVVRLTTGSSRANRDSEEEDAATKIQSHFRSYLARKALCALKGLVRLQAMVRGDLVRRQATETLRRMQALVTAQVRARTQRIQMVVDEAQTNSQIRQTNYRNSPQHPRFRQAYEMEKNAEENIKIVEMDLGEPSSSSKSRNSYSIPYSERTDHRHSTYYPSSRTPSKADNIPQQYSPSPSAYTDMSPKACSAHFEDFSFVTAQSSPQYYYSAMSIPDSTQTSIDYSFFPNYMANTQSSRAKARSQSAPRQRLDSYERQSSRRRPSVEGRNVPRGVKMQRSSSQVGLEAKAYQFPWSLKLDRSSNVSVKDSDCGSTSTVLTNYKYCTEFYGSKC